MLHLYQLNKMVHKMMNTIGLNYQNDLSKRLQKKIDFVFEKKQNLLKLLLIVQFVQ